MQTSFDAGADILPNECRFLESRGNTEKIGIVWIVFVFVEFFKYFLPISNVSLFLQDDHATQRGTIPAQAVDQEAIPEELSEGVSNEAGLTDVIIGTTLGVVGLMVVCVLRKIVWVLFSF